MKIGRIIPSVLLVCLPLAGCDSGQYKCSRTPVHTTCRVVRSDRTKVYLDLRNDELVDLFHSTNPERKVYILYQRHMPGPDELMLYAKSGHEVVLGNSSRAHTIQNGFDYAKMKSR